MPVNYIKSLYSDGIIIIIIIIIIIFHFKPLSTFLNFSHPLFTRDKK